MGIFQNFLNIFNDQKLQDLESSIEDMMKIAPPVNPVSKTSDSSSSEVISAFITPPSKDEDKPEQPEALKRMFGSDDSNGQDASHNEIQSLMDKITVPAERTNRYSVYSEVYKSVPLIKKIMNVYISNVLNYRYLY